MPLIKPTHPRWLAHWDRMRRLYVDIDASQEGGHGAIRKIRHMIEAAPDDLALVIYNKPGHVLGFLIP